MMNLDHLLCIASAFLRNSVYISTCLCFMVSQLKSLIMECKVGATDFRGNSLLLSQIFKQIDFSIGSFFRIVNSILEHF